MFFREETMKMYVTNKNGEQIKNRSYASERPAVSGADEWLAAPYYKFLNDLLLILSVKAIVDN